MDFFFHIFFFSVCTYIYKVFPQIFNDHASVGDTFIPFLLSMYKCVISDVLFWLT